jgi:hypothetical protein
MAIRAFASLVCVFLPWLNYALTRRNAVILRLLLMRQATELHVFITN